MLVSNKSDQSPKFNERFDIIETPLKSDFVLMNLTHALEANNIKTKAEISDPVEEKATHSGLHHSRKWTLEMDGILECFNEEPLECVLRQSCVELVLNGMKTVQNLNHLLNQSLHIYNEENLFNFTFQKELIKLKDLTFNIMI